MPDEQVNVDVLDAINHLRVVINAAAHSPSNFVAVVRAFQLLDAMEQHFKPKEAQPCEAS